MSEVLPPHPMISPDWVRMMARYNAWQNASALSAAATLDDAARLAPRGAFFGSIMGTLSHLLWADGVWLSRFGVDTAPQGGIRDSAALYVDWSAYTALRADTDTRLNDWAAALAPDDLTGDLTWYSGAAGREVSRARALILTHLFNHQTHHRGQVHAMLTAAGARPGDTDLFLMPAAD
ncbi:MAG: DinB family protein [Gemmobacter sp.]